MEVNTNVTVNDTMLRTMYMYKINGQKCILREDLLPLLKYNIYMLLTDEYVWEAQHKMLSMVSGMYKCENKEDLEKENVENYKKIMGNTTYRQRKEFFSYFINVMTSHTDFNTILYTKEEIEFNILPRVYNMRVWFKECSGSTCGRDSRVDEGIRDIIEEYVTKANTRLKEDGIDTRLSKREVLYKLSKFNY